MTATTSSCDVQFGCARRTARWFRRYWRFTTAALVLLAFIAMNAFAFVQAWAMTHFVDGGSRTSAPEQLTTLGKVRILFTGVRVPRPVNLTTPADVDLPFDTQLISTND